MAADKTTIESIIWGLAHGYSFFQIMDGSVSVETIVVDIASDILAEVAEIYPEIKSDEEDYENISHGLADEIRSELISHWDAIFTRTYLSGTQTNFFAADIANYVAGEIDELNSRGEAN